MDAAPTREIGYVTEPIDGFWQNLDSAERTPELRWPASIDVYQQMRRPEAQIASVLRAVTLPVRRTKWSIDATGCRPQCAQELSVDLGVPIRGETPAAPIRQRNRFSWAEHLNLALTMVPFGHSYFEPVYRWDEASGRHRLRKLGWRPPWTISKVDVATDGGLVAIEQHHGPTLGKPRRIPVEHLVAYVLDREGADWLGNSILRPAYKYWLLKDELLRLSVQIAHRNGMGVPVYTTSATPDAITDPAEVAARQEAEIQTGLDIARSARGGPLAGASIPHGAQLAFIGVQGRTIDLLPWIRYYDEQMARASLAHFLNLGGDGATGSYNLAGVFEQTFTNSLQTTAQTVCDITNQHVIEDWVDYNYGTSEPAPRIVFEEIGATHPATAEALKALADAGLLTPDPPTEAHIRRTRGLPAHDPDSAPALAPREEAPDAA